MTVNVCRICTFRLHRNAASLTVTEKRGVLKTNLHSSCHGNVPLLLHRVDTDRRLKQRPSYIVQSVHRGCWIHPEKSQSVVSFADCVGKTRRTGKDLFPRTFVWNVRSITAACRTARLWHIQPHIHTHTYTRDFKMILVF